MQMQLLKFKYIFRFTEYVKRYSILVFNRLMLKLNDNLRALGTKVLFVYVNLSIYHY